MFVNVTGGLKLPEPAVDLLDDERRGPATRVLPRSITYLKLGFDGPLARSSVEQCFARLIKERRGLGGRSPRGFRRREDPCYDTTHHNDQKQQARKSIDEGFDNLKDAAPLPDRVALSL